MLFDVALLSDDAVGADAGAGLDDDSFVDEARSAPSSTRACGTPMWRVARLNSAPR
jgi:hypothetical protein